MAGAGLSYLNYMPSGGGGGGMGGMPMGLMGGGQQAPVITTVQQPASNYAPPQRRSTAPEAVYRAPPSSPSGEAPWYEDPAFIHALGQSAAQMGDAAGWYRVDAPYRPSAATAIGRGAGGFTSGLMGYQEHEARMAAAARQEEDHKRRIEGLQTMKGMVGQRPDPEPRDGVGPVRPGSGYLGGEVPWNDVLATAAATPGFEQYGMQGLSAQALEQSKRHGRPFPGTGVEASALNNYIRSQSAKKQADNPGMTPEEVKAFESDLTAKLSERRLMQPRVVGYDPVTRMPIATPPAPLPGATGATPQGPPQGPPPGLLPGAQQPGQVRAPGRRLNDQELIEQNMAPGTNAVWTAEGYPKVINKPSEAQVKAGHYTKRMEGAEKDIWQDPETGQAHASGLATLEADDLDKLTDRWAYTRVAYGGALGESTVSPEYRQYLQYARTWISGLLRYDSGAAVPEEEFWRYFQTNFAMPGDDKVTVAQKRRARAREAESLRRTGALSDGSKPWEARPQATQSRSVVAPDGNVVTPPPGTVLVE
jgi:hypothetical protein